MEEQPGPPLNHVARGAVEGLWRDSKNLFSHIELIRLRFFIPSIKIEGYGEGKGRKGGKGGYQKNTFKPSPTDK